MKKILLMALAWLAPWMVQAENYTPAEFSVAGLIPLEESGRVVYALSPSNGRAQ